MSSTRNRKQQREARVLARERGISYQAALRQLAKSRRPDLDAARQLGQTLLEAGFDLADVFRREVLVSDHALEDVAAIEFDTALRHANQHGLGLLCRAARLCGMEPPTIRMPGGYPTAVVREARAHADSLGGDREWPDLDAPHEAAAMFEWRPAELIGAAVVRWLAAGHPQTLVDLAGIQWRSEPAELPSEESGRGLLADLHAVAATGMLDAEALEATREVLLRWLTEEPRVWV